MIFRWGRKGGGSSPGAGKDTDAPASDRVYRAGDVIGGEFQVLKVMEGGLGVVYMVERRERREGEHALSVLKTPKGQSDPIVRDNFRTEAETWVRLGYHPNIVTAFFVDELLVSFSYRRNSSLRTRPAGYHCATICTLVHCLPR